MNLFASDSGFNTYYWSTLKENGGKLTFFSSKCLRRDSTLPYKCFKLSEVNIALPSHQEGN